jgi:hypothetical protein
MKRFHLSLCVVAALYPAFGWAQDNGADAFAARDFARAQTLWLDEAAEGSPDAMLGLGLLADRGFGQPRDIDLAFDWYEKAANLGLAEAQFNIAIMYDAGIGRARDAGAAQLWYTRAALRDHTRAQYNLGLLLEAGDGIAANPALAAHWFDLAAASIPAAAEKPRDATVRTDTITAPDITFAQADRQGMELIWDVTPQTSSRYLVEALRAPLLDADYSAPLTSQSTVASAYLDTNLDNALWRVSNLSDDGLDYAASRWVVPQDVIPPKGRVTFVIDPELASMAQAADVFADQLRGAGYWVRVDTEAPEEFTDFYISYGYTSDQVFADEVAQYLPILGEFTPLKQVVGATHPEEIFVNLAALR